jgi:ABC-2 type transport system permease protein
VIHRGFEEELTKVSVAGRVDVMVSTLEYVLANFGNRTSPENRSQMESGLSALKAFRASLSSGTVEVTYVRDPNDRASSAVEGVIRSFLAAFNLRLLGANESVTVSPADLGFRRTRPIDYYLPGILMAFVMTNGVLGVAPPLAEMRKSRQLKRLAITPLKLSELLTGFMLVQVLMSSVLAALLVAVGWAVFRPSFTLNPYAFALTVVASLFFTSLGLLIGSALKELEAIIAASNVIVFPMMFLSGAFWPLEFAPPIMRAIAGFTPLYYFAEGLRSVGVYGELGPSLTAFAIGLVASPVLLFIGSSLLGRELAE